MPKRLSKDGYLCPCTASLRSWRALSLDGLTWKVQNLKWIFNRKNHELALLTCHRLECFLVTKSLWITFVVEALCAIMRTARPENRLKRRLVEDEGKFSSRVLGFRSSDTKQIFHEGDSSFPLRHLKLGEGGQASNFIRFNWFPRKK